MSAAQTKSLLKSARDSLKNKEYEDALENCENIFAINSTSYNAYVFAGAAAEGLNRTTDACEYYQKAVNVDPKSLLAYQGVVRLLDGKQAPLDSTLSLPAAQRDLLIKSHGKLANYYHLEKKDITKWAHSLHKLTGLLCSLNRNKEAVTNWETFLDSVDDDVDVSVDVSVDVLLNAYISLAKALEKTMQDGGTGLENTYRRILYLVDLSNKEADTKATIVHETQQNLLKHLRTLYYNTTNQEDHTKALRFAIDIWDCLPKERPYADANDKQMALFVLENLCELMEEDAGVCIDDHNILRTYMNTLCEVDPKHGLALIHAAITPTISATVNGSSGTSSPLLDYDFTLLSQGVEKYPNYATGWVLLVLRLARGRRHARAREIGCQALSYMRTTSGDGQLSGRARVLCGVLAELRVSDARVLMEMGESHRIEARKVLNMAVNELRTMDASVDGHTGAYAGIGVSCRRTCSGVGARIQLANCTMAMGNWHEAVKWLSEGLEMCTGERFDIRINGGDLMPSIVQASIESELGWALHQAGGHTEALDRYIHAMSVFEDTLTYIYTNTQGTNSADTSSPSNILMEKYIPLLNEGYAQCQGRIGIVYYDMPGSVYQTVVLDNGIETEDQPMACSRHLLQSAKRKPDTDHPHVFMYLGNFYTNMSVNSARGLKCYAKAIAIAIATHNHTPTPYPEEIWGSSMFFVNTFSVDQTVLLANKLSDMYLDASLVEDAHKLHLRLTTSSISGHTGSEIRNRIPWAFFRAGLHYQNTGQFQKAIDFFQSALRVDSHNPQGWECLGECYLQLGQFVAAHKALTKSLSIYTDEGQTGTSRNIDLKSVSCCRARIAEVMCTLSLYAESLEAYSRCLREDSRSISGRLGQAQTHLSYAFDLLSEGRGVAAVATAAEGLAGLLNYDLNFDLVNYMAYWKLVGDICFFFHKALSISEKAYEDTLKPIVDKTCAELEGFTIHDNIGVQAMLELGLYAYQRGLQVVHMTTNTDTKESNTRTLVKAGLESDVAIVFVLLKKYDEAVEAAKQAVKTDRTLPHSWRVLGFVCADSKSQSYAALAQHAFIVALQLQPQHAPTWTNLGLFYLAYDATKLALKSFGRAQACDPSFARAWVGQAFIATTLADDVGKELYHHSAEMDDPEPEGLRGYAQNVYRDFKNSIGKGHSITQFCIEQEQAKNLQTSTTEGLKLAALSLDRSLAKCPMDVWSWNTLGVIRELLGLNLGAKTAFEQALKLLLNGNESDIHREQLPDVASNLARTLCRSKEYNKALEVYTKYTSTTNDLYCALGMGNIYFQTGRLQEAQEAYLCAFQLATSKDEMTIASDTQVAIGLTAYAMGDSGTCKDTLFRALQLSPTSTNPVATLGALGLLTSDMELVGAALAEEKKLPNENRRKPSTSYDFAILRSCWWLLQGNPQRACQALTRSIHNDGAYLPIAWSMTASFARMRCKNSLALPLALYESAWEVITDTNNTATTMAETLSAHSDALLRYGCENGHTRANGALRKAQAAVFRDPSSVRAWASLANGLLTSANSPPSRNSQTHAVLQESKSNSLNLALRVCDYVRVRSRELESQLVAEVASSSAIKIRNQAVPLIAVTQWASQAMCECLTLLGASDSSVQQHSSPNPYLDMAMGLAVQCINEYQGDDAGRATWLRLLARVHLARSSAGETAEAIAHLRSAIGLSASPSIVWVHLSELFRRDNKTEAARLCLREAVNACPEDGGPEYTTNLVRLAWLDMLTGHVGDCETSLQTVSTISRETVSVSFLRGVCGLMNKDRRQARRAFTKVLAEANVDSTWHSLATTLLEQCA
eukprot:CFRG1182T1